MSERSSETVQCDVLVIGAGATGLAMACEALRHGLSCRIVDAQGSSSAFGQAQILHTRTLEVFEQMGVIGDFLRAGRALHLLSMYTPDLRRLFHFTVGEFDSAYPYMLSLSQHETERILEAKLRAYGVQVERPFLCEALSQDDGWAEVSGRSAPDGPLQSIRAAWVVGCDGGNSFVRHALSIPWQGNTYRQRVLQADVKLAWPLLHAHDEVFGFASEHGAIGIFPLPADGRYRLLALDAGLAPTRENFQFLLDTRGPAETRIEDVAWLHEYTIHCRMASAFRRGRVFLAGDAAHTLSPATAQGMNLGIQDAFNLAWKLALVQRGNGRDILLDSYEAERMPVAAELLKTSDLATRGLHDLFTVHGSLAQGLRNSFLELFSELGLVRRSVSRNLSMLDIGYPHSPIVGQHHASRLTEPAADGQPPLPNPPQVAISLRQWLDFGHGPAPGLRAQDGRLRNPGSAETVHLHSLLHSGQHLLLLFAGSAETEAGYRRLVALGTHVHERHSRAIRVCMIEVSRPSESWGLPGWAGALLLDENGTLHQTYGARAECVYLLRPDGHVAFRSQPADPIKVQEYLDRIWL
jgi:2-polyprenyl-6-methoxyphenol hydroxylase-like FAD-dependent oxidoreductase